MRLMAVTRMQYRKVRDIFARREGAARAAGPDQGGGVG